jgi:hypothetical protein
LHASYDVRRVNHSIEYKAEDGANVNHAESYFSRLRRAEIGQHHRISGHLLYQYANEAAWRRMTAASRTARTGIRSSTLRSPAAKVRFGPATGTGAQHDGRKAAREHVISGLIEKRRELAGIIDQLQRQLDQHRADLTHIDGVLRVLATDLDPETIKPKRHYRRNRYFARNELSRLCLGVLRTAAGELLSTDDFGGQVIAGQGLRCRRRDLARGNSGSGFGIFVQRLASSYNGAFFAQGRWREMDSNSRSPVSDDTPQRPRIASPGIISRNLGLRSHQRLRALRGDPPSSSCDQPH